MLPNVVKRIKTMVTDLGNVVQRDDVWKARNLIERLLGQIPLIPNQSEKILAAQLSMDLSSLILIVNQEKYNDLVAGAGFEPATFGL
jgi:hypothetical protein